MSYIQLVSPNTNAVGRLGYCLEYAARVFNCSGVAPYAWTAWLQTQTKHQDRNHPLNVAVPLWFSYVSGGINQGHVVVFVPGQGYYSSPWQYGTNHAVLGSISEIEKIYGASYVGWSEDILNVQVVRKEADMPNEGDVHNAYLKANGRKATPEEVAIYTSKPWGSADGLVYGKIFVDLEASKNASFVPVTDQLFKKV